MKKVLFILLLFCLSLTLLSCSKKKPSDLLVEYKLGVYDEYGDCYRVEPDTFYYDGQYFVLIVNSGNNKYFIYAKDYSNANIYYSKYTMYVNAKDVKKVVKYDNKSNH